MEKAGALLDMLENYAAAKTDGCDYAFMEGLSVLSAYLEFTDNDCDEYRNRCRALCEKCGKLLTAGVIEIPDVDQMYGGFDLEQIKKFICSRHSIRSFRNEVVDIDILQKAVALSQHAPSACNRQPVKVYLTNDLHKVREIDILIPGNKGFEGEIPNWAILTANRNMFGNSELLQWYVNGGIYLAYFVEALHAYKLGSCIFQIPAVHQNTPRLRAVASIPEQEVIIAAVGFGYPKSSNKILATARRPVDEVLVQF